MCASRSKVTEFWNLTPCNGVDKSNFTEKIAASCFRGESECITFLRNVDTCRTAGCRIAEDHRDNPKLRKITVNSHYYVIGELTGKKLMTN